jgi:hypothetical protein
MNRSDIRGWTIRFKGFYLEYVSVCRMPACLALSKGTKTLWRLERGII